MLSKSGQTNDDISFTFQVDDVKPKQGKLSFENFERTFRRLTYKKEKMLYSSHQNDESSKFISTGYKMMGAVAAIHAAYMGHYYLKLSVSDFILMIGQGLALHMAEHAEELRPHFVNFEGKETITIRSLTEDWPEIIEKFSLEVKKRVKTDLYDVIIDDTTVATKLSKIASEIAILDSFKHYFRYYVSFECGIPQITLIGSKDDWERLRSKVKKLQELNKGNKLKLDWWLKELVPLVDNIVKQAVSRKIDRHFWQNIYKYHEKTISVQRWGCGHPYMASETIRSIDGWISKFIPYTKGKNTFDGGVDPSSVPNGVSKVPFTLEWGGGPCSMTLYGGFIGAQLVGDDTIQPAYFYAICPNGKEEEEE